MCMGGEIVTKNEEVEIVSMRENKEDEKFIVGPLREINYAEELKKYVSFFCLIFLLI